MIGVYEPSQLRGWAADSASFQAPLATFAYPSSAVCQPLTAFLLRKVCLHPTYISTFVEFAYNLKLKSFSFASAHPDSPV